MNSCTHCAFEGTAESTKARLGAERIYAKVQTMGTRQVRIYRGKMLTYPHPAPRSYGTRGILVGIYSPGVRLEWIEEDLLRAMSGQETVAKRSEWARFHAWLNAEAPYSCRNRGRDDLWESWKAAIEFSRAKKPNRRKS